MNTSFRQNLHEKLAVPFRFILALIFALNAALGLQLHAQTLDTTTNLVMWLNFSNNPAVNSGVVTDQSPTGSNSGIVSNQTTWVATQDGRQGVMSFNGTDPDGITVQPSPSLNSTVGTIAFWMESPNATPGPGAMLFDHRQNNDPAGSALDVGDIIYQTSDGHLNNQSWDVQGHSVNSQETTANPTDNHWHHFAYVYDQSASGGVVLYVDGVLDTTNGNNNSWSWNTNQEIEIGFSHDTYWSGYTGYLDDIRIYNRKLINSEIASLAGLAPTPQIVVQVQPPSITNAAKDTASFTVKATVVNGNPSLLTYQWQTGSTNIPGATNATYSFNTVLTDNGKTFQVVLSYPGVTNLTSVSATNNVIADLDVVYSFDAAPAGGTDIIDSSTNTTSPHDANNFNATWIASKDGRNGVMYFNGTDPNGTDGITIPAAPELCSSRGSIAFWMESSNVTANGYVMMFDRRSSGVGGDVIYQGPDGHLNNQANIAGFGTANSQATPANLTDNHWHHFAYVYDQSASGFISFYVDGALVATKLNSHALVWDANQESEIGYSHDSFWKVYTGYLDEFRIYNRVLSPNEIAQLAGLGGLPQIVITTQPSNVIMGANDQVKFNVAATVINTNGASIAYNWKKNGTNVLGATNSSYSFTSAAADSGATFQVVLSYSGATNVISTVASLTVLPEFVVHYEFLQDPAANGNIIVDSSTVGTNSGYNGGNSLYGGSYGTATWLASQDGHTNVMSFDQTGPNQILIVPSLTLKSVRGTIAFWMESTNPGNYYAAVFDCRTNAGGGDVFFQQPGGTISDQAQQVSGNTVCQLATSSNVSDGTWHHIAYEYDQAAGGFVNWYVDGVLNKTKINNLAWPWAPNEQIEIGRSHDPFWRAYGGYLADFRIYSRVLSSTEIAQLAGIPSVSPSLSITVANGQLTLSWSVAGFVLQQNSSLTNPAGWTDVANGTVSPVQMPAPANGTQFYRLKSL